jgi:hypothetical protein
VIYD